MAGAGSRPAGLGTRWRALGHAAWCELAAGSDARGRDQQRLLIRVLLSTGRQAHPAPRPGTNDAQPAASGLSSSRTSPQVPPRPCAPLPRAAHRGAGARGDWPGMSRFGTLRTTATSLQCSPAIELIIDFQLLSCDELLLHQILYQAHLTGPEPCEGHGRKTVVLRSAQVGPGPPSLLLRDRLELCNAAYSMKDPRYCGHARVPQPGRHTAPALLP